MSKDTPIACSLGTDELTERLAEISALGRGSLLSVDAAGHMHFRADEATRQRLEAIIAAESRCCSFLSFELREEAGARVLAITAPDDAKPLALDLVKAFAANAEAA